MSSRIVRGTEGDPMTWRVIGGTEPAAPLPRPVATVQRETETRQWEARIAQLEREVQDREQRAFSSGYSKGEAAGRAQEATRLEAAIAGLVQCAAQLSSQRRQLRHDAEEDCVKLAVAVARRILRRELAMDPEALLGIVKAALTRLEGREVERLRVHPEDAELVRRFLEQSSERGSVTVYADSSLERGSCKFETARGDLDASIESQLAEIQRGLVDRVR